MSNITIVTLGTGSGKPTPVRNVSATALIREGEMVLFDCGEGTQIQIQRARLRLSKLRVVCITHMHGDHVNGLPGLLGSMGLNHHEGRVTLIGPRGIGDYLDALKRHHIFYPAIDLEVIETPPEGGRVFEGEAYDLMALPLRHRVPTHGFRWVEHDKPGRFDVEAARALEIPSGPLYGRLQRGEAITLEDGRTIEPERVVGPPRPGRVIAYCTDTSPCDNAVELGRDADLLIHEGTYAPDLASQARQRGHSTVIHAARTAARANARRLLITHISPKHTDVRALRDAARQVFASTRVARDLYFYEV